MPFDAFLKIEGVEGGSTAAKHKGEIDILSYSWGVSNTGAQGGGGGGGGGAGKAVPLDFTFTHAIDKASPVLMLACATGKHYPLATFTVETSGEERQRYLVIKLTDVLVSSLNQQGAFPAEGGGPPLEDLSLSFTKIDFAHYSRNAQGQEIITQTSFDFKRQR